MLLYCHKLPDRLMAGRLVLVQEIGVRVPVGQLLTKSAKSGFCVTDARHTKCLRTLRGTRTAGMMFSAPCPEQKTNEA